MNHPERASHRRASAARRRRQVRSWFEGPEQVRREWKRYDLDPRHRLWRELRERFLQRHLGRSQTVLEVGPGPGRFTSTILRTRPERYLAADLSRGALVAARRRARRGPTRQRVAWLQAAGEHLPVAQRSLDAVVLYGNVLGMSARDGPLLLEEIARCLKPGGRLIADVATPAASMQEFLFNVARVRWLGRVLRRRSYYLIDRILSDGYQPLLPRRLARWEFMFYPPAALGVALRAAGLEVEEIMSVAPVSSWQPDTARIARRSPTAWRSLVELEEIVGRRPGTLETGHGLVVCARVRRGARNRVRHPESSNVS